MPRYCSCPPDGAYLCSRCASLAARVAPDLHARLPVVAEPEADLQARIRRLAQEHGWLAYHTRDSRGSEKGYPDLTLAKPGRLVFAELKSATGKLSKEQSVWLAVLAVTLPGVEAYCWRPQDWAKIVTCLTGKRDHHTT